jgi:hypothetical protein
MAFMQDVVFQKLLGLYELKSVMAYFYEYLHTVDAMN